MIDFEYKEIVRVNNKVVGHIEKCRSGYFYRPKGGECRSKDDFICFSNSRSKLYDEVDQVRSLIKKHHKQFRVKYNGK